MRSLERALIWWDWCPYKKIQQRAGFFSFCQVRTQQGRYPSSSQEERCHQELNWLSPWSWISSLETMRNMFLLVKPLGLVFCYGSLSWLRPWLPPFIICWCSPLGKPTGSQSLMLPLQASLLGRKGWVQRDKTYTRVHLFRMLGVFLMF